MHFLINAHQPSTRSLMPYIMRHDMIQEAACMERSGSCLVCVCHTSGGKHHTPIEPLPSRTSTKRRLPGGCRVRTDERRKRSSTSCGNATALEQSGSTSVSNGLERRLSQPQEARSGPSCCLTSRRGSHRRRRPGSCDQSRSNSGFIRQNTSRHWSEYGSRSAL